MGASSFRRKCSNEHKRMRGVRSVAAYLSTLYIYPSVCDLNVERWKLDVERSATNHEPSTMNPVPQTRP